MADVNPLDALDEAPSAAPVSAMAPAPASPSSNPLDALDEPAQSNPLDRLETPLASERTASRMQDVTDQAQMPTVTVTARGGPDSSWSDVARGVPTTIGAGIETKAAGAQEYIGHAGYDDAKKKFWQATILPQAVRDAKDQGVALTDLPEVQDAAKHAGVRVDVFTRDWPTYVNMSPDQVDQVQRDQRDRMQTGAQQIESGTRRRLTAQQVQESYAPRMDNHSMKALVFDSATMIPDLLAGVGGTVATGGVGGAAIMAADIAPNEYAAARNKGLDHQTASTYAMLSTLASSVPEVPVLKVVENTPLANKVIGSVVGDKLAQTGVGKVAGTAAAQGVTQSVVNALQQGIDAGVLNEHLPLDEALKQVAWSGLVGGVVGAPMGVYHAATSRKPKPTTFQEIPETGGGNEQEEPQAPSVAPPSLDHAPTSIDNSGSENPPQTENISGAGDAAQHAALLAVQDKTITPPQADLLEKAGLIKRNDLNEPVLLPAGRRRLAQLAQEVSDRAVQPEGPTEGTPEHRLATDQDLRAGLAAMKDETGWAEKGGRLIRDATSDQAVGRTSWIPNADWWPGRPRGLTEDQVHEAVDKALAGQELSTREQQTVDYMTQVHDERVQMDRDYQDLKSAVPDLEHQPDEAIDWTLLASRAASHDEDAANRVIAGWADDTPETMTRVRGELEQIIGRGQQTEKPRGSEPPEAQGAPGQEKAFEEALERARQDTHTHPTEGQKVAGNYRKGRLDFGGMEVALENPKGSTRSGVGADGKPWSRELEHDYGYFTGTKGADGDAIDTFLTGKPDTGKIFAINQVDPETGKFDEVKVVAGAESAQEAQEVYHANYPRGWKGLGSMAEVPTGSFKEWLDSGNTHKPYPGAARVERRAVSAAGRRAKVAEMSPEELRRELLTHELTGIPNRRAYTEARKLPRQVSIDVDSLKWVNDNMGHESGNELLKAIASSLCSHSDNVFHLSGDEFAAQAHTETEAHELLRNVAEHLKGASIEVEMPDGRLVKLKGLGVSYGVGKTLEEADAALQSHKTRRQAEGARAARGEAPPGATFGAREEGRQDQTGSSAKSVEPKSRRAQPSTGLPRSAVERIVHQTVREANLVSGFPHVEVHSDVSTLPQSIKRIVEEQGAESLTGALYDPSTGRIHLIASNNASEAEVRENLWHEAVGHHGLRMVMDGPRYNAVMDGIARDMPERVDAAARRNGLDLDDLAQKRAAAEEVIAYAAGQHLSGQPIAKPVLPYWKRAVRAVRAFFARMTGAPFYDDRAIAGLIQRARQALERGTTGSVPGGPLRSTRAPTFYSPVERFVESSKQNKASGEQWLATIKKAGGVKPDELEWLDLENWLKGQKSVTREQLQDYVRANRLELQETLHGAVAGTQDSEDERLQTRLAEQILAKGHTVSFDGQGNLESINVALNEPGWHGAHAIHEPDDFGALPENIRSVAAELREVSTRVANERENRAIAHGDFYENDSDRTKYGEYTLPGGQNYRELLLRKPDPRAPSDPLEQVPFNWQYRSSHWDEPNILAHVRFKERTDSEGRKVLHIEEIQSDWHKQGREHGYPQSEEAIANARETRDRAGLEHAAAGETAANTYRADFAGTEEEAIAARQRLPITQRALTAAQREYDKAKGAVPNAPFKTSWPMLAMKRMIRWAAEKGFDRIAWTTGAQQNERYRLSQVVNGIEHNPREDGGRNVILDTTHGLIRFATDADGGITETHSPLAAPFKGKNLSELVGTNIADRILKSPREFGTLFGDNLGEIGGEGMRGFYDQILPRETDKLIKKYGGQVTDGHVSGHVPDSDLHREAEEYLKEALRGHGIDGRAIRRILDNWNEGGEQEARRIAPSNVNHYLSMVRSAVSHESHGFDITPQMRQIALSEGFPLFSRSQQPLPLEEQKERGAYALIRRAVNAVHDSKGVADVRKLINPAGMTAEARQTAVVAREALGQLAHETVKTQEALEHFSREVDRMPVVDQLAMMDAIEKGEQQPNPELQPIADGMRKMLDTWRTKVQGLGEGYLDNFIENYFPHYWRFPDEAQRMVASIMGRRPLRGPASFLKMRTIPSIKEGMDAGLTPLTTNPLIMTLLKTREMQRFVTGVTLMKRFKEDGLAKFLRAGTPMPDGWAPINDNIAKVRQWSEVENGFIERGQYIMPLEAARVINNHVSASALRDFAPAQIFRRGANALNAMQLGFSAFHLGFTTLDAMISKNAQGIERLMHGEVGNAVQSFGEGLTPVGAFTNVRRGYKLLQAYSDPAGATPDMQRLVRMLESAGGRAHMDRYYQAAEGFSPFRGVGLRSLANDVRQALTAPTDKLQNLGHALGSFPREYANKLMRGMQEIWQTTPMMEVPVEVAMRIVRASTSWIMEHLVPMQKLGVFSDLAADHLRRNPFQDPNERTAAMQRIWDSVDNRLGEMVYDNLFWNRTMKDSLHLAIRAVGWNVGTVREIGGAPIDVVKAVDKLIRTGKVTAADLGHRIPYVLAMASTTALYGAAYQYMATGQGPQELKDYFFPRSGGTTNYGTPERVSLPSYVKDMYEYAHRPGTTVVNKLNPIFSLLGNLYSNQDFFGNPITDPEAGYWQQKLQQLQFAGHEMTPFSLQGRQQMQQTEQPGGFGAAVKKTLPMIGVTPAPGYITSGEQMERRQRLEADQKYVGELHYKIKKALEAGDKDGAKELTAEYVEARKRMAQTKGLVDQDRAKAAAARRKTATSMRQQGMPRTADLVAALPLEPDAAARQYFSELVKSAA